MSLGFEQAGVCVPAAFDSDPVNVEYHRRNFPRSLTYQDDVSKLSATDLLKKADLAVGDIDVLFGGPPCQGFSEIGQRKHGDHRNLLILEFARLIRALQPRYFVVENVRGLLYSYSKSILDSFVLRVKRSGYNVLDPIQVLDASNYGVPQKRRRAFIIGHLKSVSAPEYPKPLRCDDEFIDPPTVAEAIGDLPSLALHADLLESDVFTGKLGIPSDYAKVLRGESIDPGDHSYRRTSPREGLSGCFRTSHSAETMKRFRSTAPGTYEQGSRYYRLKLDGQSNTLRAGTGPLYGSFTAARPIHPTEPRCITTREAARLHSFPDWFEFHPTKWHGFKQVGNAVPPRLARAVAESIVRAACKH